MVDSPSPEIAAQLRADLPASAVSHVLGVFQSEMQGLVKTLHDAALAEDPVEYRRIAHRIAGSAAAVGAADLEKGARLAMECARSRPDRIVEVADEVSKLSEAACASAAEVVTALG